MQTAKELCDTLAEKPDTLRMRLNTLREAGNPLFADVRWSLRLSLSDAQAEALLSASQRNPAGKEARRGTVGKTAMMAPTARPNEAAPERVNPSPMLRAFPLWAVLTITAGASVPNMFEVTTAIKGDTVTAYALTAAFTATPFLMVYARVAGFWAWAVVLGVMGYTAFCNTAAIFGGLTSMDTGYIMRPTVFLEAVTNYCNTDYLNTARVVSGLMAMLIGAIEVVAFKHLAK